MSKKNNKSKLFHNKDLGSPNDKSLTQVLKREEITIRISSPIPPPKTMREYKEIMPTAPEKFFAIADKQTNHRHKIEEKEVNGQNFRANIGLLLGWISVLFFGGIGAFLLYRGQNIAGYTFLLGATIPRLLSFAYAYPTRKKELAKHNK